MATIKYRRVMAREQTAFKAAFVRTMTRAAGDVALTVHRAAGLDGVIPRRAENDVLLDANRIVNAVFTAPDGRTTVDANGGPRSPYAELLLTHIARSVQGVVAAHAAWLEKHAPDDVKGWLRGGRIPPQDETAENRANSAGITVLKPGGVGIAEMAVPVQEIDEGDIRQQPGESDDEYIQRMQRLRIFHPNPLSEYDPPHLWVDPNGYRLSDRIWRTDRETRQRLDALIAEYIRNGRSASDLARAVERFLIPGRAGLRTRRPYGTDASYFAMRLARSEIASAFNRAAFITAYMNPYVDNIEVARSPWGDPSCPICALHATLGMGGERLRPPYHITSAAIPIYHPHCMCTVVPVVTDSPEAVTERLRALIEESRRVNLQPNMTPIAQDTFVRMLLGDAVMRLVVGVLTAPLQGLLP